MTDETQSQFNAPRVIATRAVAGAIIAFLLTVVVVLIAGEDLFTAVAIGGIPAAFAGPFVAGLMVVIAYHHSGLDDH
jgi:uncharacterized RDD family membrane protein YckC